MNGEEGGRIWIIVVPDGRSEGDEEWAVASPQVDFLFIILHLWNKGGVPGMASKQPRWFCGKRPCRKMGTARRQPIGITFRNRVPRGFGFGVVGGGLIVVVDGGGGGGAWWMWIMSP